MDDCGLTRRAVQSAIKKLVDLGLVKVTERIGYTNKYALIQSALKKIVIKAIEKMDDSDVVIEVDDDIAEETEKAEAEKKVKAEKKASEKKAKAEKAEEPPTLEQIKDVCCKNGYIADYAAFYAYYSSRNWHDKNGVAMARDWEKYLWRWNNGDKEKAKTNIGLRNYAQPQAKMSDEEIADLFNKCHEQVTVADLEEYNKEIPF